MLATIMYRAGDVRVENVPDATHKEPTDALGVTRSFRQSLALAESSCMVELQQYCRSLTGRIGRLNPHVVQLEGLAPAVRARVEEADELRWVANQSAEVASLVVIATGAGPREVGWLRGAAVLTAYDVVHLAAPKRVVLVDEAIFADVIGAFGDLSPQRFTQITGHEPEAGGHGPWPAA